MVSADCSGVHQCRELLAENNELQLFRQEDRESSDEHYISKALHPHAMHPRPHAARVLSSHTNSDGITAASNDTQQQTARRSSRCELLGSMYSPFSLSTSLSSVLSLRGHCHLLQPIDIAITRIIFTATCTTGY